MVADEIADWLYPYRNRLTPEERFEVRVKDPHTEEMYMVEELIQALNQKVDALQDDMIYVKHKLTEHEQLLQLNPKFRVRKASYLTAKSFRLWNFFNSHHILVLVQI